MIDERINPNTVTGRIYTKALEILDKNPEGIRWKDLNEAIQRSNPEFHPKTINGCVWKLTEKFPDKVYKPSRGVFKLLKYRK
ncbi:hypothetical protein GF319_07450 [Candidatus Bathyarchaeota archaeon]|nr:hypothetical protein [Candidatus Bathyarchaeota archaeon]